MVENINKIIIDIIGLYRYNYLTEFHVRQIAKLINKSHAGLLPHLNNLEKTKVLVSKEVGKSKVFSLNLENNQIRELLSIAEKKGSLELLNKEIFIKKIYEEFLKLNLMGSLVLFGSYASETNTKESDIDLLWLGNLKETEIKKIKNFGKMYNKEIHLVSMSFKEFDVQLSKGGALIKEIVNNHIVLSNSDLFVNEMLRYYGRKRA
jgi:predicted nucleotidyltransferase